MYGIDFPPVGERMGRLAETLEAFRLLCSQEVTDYEGRYVQLTGALFEPKPVRPSGIPLLVGGSGQRLKRIAARFADIFNSFPAPWEWRAVNDDLDAKARAAGREPGDVVRSAFVFSELSGDPEKEATAVRRFQETRGGSVEEIRRRILGGSPEEMIAVAQSYEDAGISLIVINLRPPFDTVGLERFARDVLPAFSG
jgi:alkanesulfonate monooxygenase SsuD/methylene tetrahydromethanopterin reductase-like flavin-dependent oxidoreductase (luciferase family)